MEQFVLGFFQEHLARYIVGFRKEQVNANLLNGKGEIRNVDLNCAVLNEELARMTPFVNLERVQISRLSFHVESWTNLKNAPIHIDLQDITVDVNEPLHYLNPEDRDMILQLTLSEFRKMVAENLLPKPRKNSYNLLDRIADNMSIDIHSVTMNYQTYGKFKTARLGPWTPPGIQMRLFGIKIYTVDSFGYKYSEDVRRRGEHTAMIYKKVETEFQLSILENETRIPIIQKAKLEIQAAVKRRLSDAEIMSVQMDVTIPNLEIRIDNDTVRPLAHFVSTIQYTLAKDRCFVDPLNSNHKTVRHPDGASLSVTISKSSAESTPSLLDDASSDELESEEAVKQELSKSDHSDGPRRSTAADRILLIMPNGMVVHEQVSCSLSIHGLSIKGVYKESGHILLMMKGAILEAMWPKVTREKGGYIQASLSYLSVQEQYDNRIRYLLVGGAQYNKEGPVEKPSKPLSELGRDETFPLYEDRCVRPDPIGLRHTFPSQAVGFKMTVGYVDDTEMLVMNEIGVDEIDLVLDASSWGRVIQFINDVENGGFDPRWHTGDWTNLLTVDMLLHPSAPLILDNHLQPIKQLFLDENEFPSSDLFNATIRVRNTCIRMPAAIDQDVRSCDIVVEFDETMIVVSSALPRSLLSDQEGKAVSFPNDPSDISHSFEKTDDPSDRESGLVTSRSVSTFRTQLTLRGLAIKLASIIPFHESKEPQKLLLPAELTMILCFEGRPPSGGDNLTEIVTVVSVLAHRFAMNFDFDLMVSAISTLSSHVEKASAIQKVCHEVAKRAQEICVEKKSSAQRTLITASDNRIESSLQGRKIRVTRQLRQSRETGGVKLAVWAQIAGTRFTVWRHNVPRSSPLRSTREGSGEFVPVLRLLDCSTKNIDFGGETSFFRKDRRLMMRISVGELCLSICSFRALLRRDEVWVKAFEISPQSDKAAKECCDVANMTSLVSFGETGQNQCAFAFRAEELLGENYSWSLSCDCSDGTINCRIEDLEMVALLVLEALLMPVWTKHNVHGEDTPLFPRDTAGGLLASMLSIRTEDLRADKTESVAESESHFEVDKEDPANNICQFLPCQLVDSGVIPKSLSILLLRCGLNGVKFIIPSDDLSQKPNRPVIGTIFHQTNISLGCFASDSLEKAAILGIYARSEETWSALTKNKGKGLFHSVLSRQSLLFSNGSCTLEPLVGPCEVSYSYRNSNVELSVSDRLSISNVEKLEAFCREMVNFSTRFEDVVSGFSDVLAPVVSAAAKKNDRGGPHRQRSPNPSSVACSSAVESIRSVKNWFLKVNESLASADKYSKARLAKKETEIANLKRLLFSKEKERIAALALVDSVSCGWLRYGSPSQSGQRSMITCTMWPHWVVLRRSLIILYEGPGLDRAVNTICLLGSSVHTLGGEQRIYDVKRTFCIVDASGCTHFLTTPTDADYVTWVSAIQRAIKMASNNETANTGLAENHAPSSSVAPNTDLRDVCEVSDQSDTKSPSANISEHAVDGFVPKRTYSLDTVHENPGQNDQVSGIASLENTNGPEKGKQLRTRFSGASQATRRGLGSARQATKNRLGSALQAAKQKGKEVAERRRQKHGVRDDDVDSQFSAPSVDASVESDADGWACQSCTFMNSTSHTRCLMCDTPRSALENRLAQLSPGPARSASYDNASTDSSTSKLFEAEDLLQELSAGELKFDVLDDKSSDAGSEGVGSQGGSSETGGPRRGVRHRLGAAVRRARTGMGDNQRVFRRQRQDRSSASKTTRLRNVSVGSPLDGVNHPFSSEEDIVAANTDLKTLKGLWHVTVCIVGDSEGNEDYLSPTAFSPDSSSGTNLADQVPETPNETADDSNVPMTDEPDNAQPDKRETEDDALSDAVSDPSGIMQPDSVIFEFKATSFDVDQNSRTETTARRDFQDIISLHTSMSELLARVPSAHFDPAQNIDRTAGVGMNDRLEAMLGLTPLDAVLTTGKLLGGLLVLPIESIENKKAHMDYICDLIAAFLNSLLESAVPLDALSLLIDFLSLPKASTAPSTPTGDKLRTVTWNEPTTDDDAEFPVSRQELFSLSSLCETELMRAESQTILAEKLARSASQTKSATKSISIERPSLSATRFQEAMHSTLMKVMAERDEAHACMVSSDVLHMHEMEQQRRKAEHVESQLDLLKRAATANYSTEREKRETETLRKYERQRQNDLDDELVSLCQQLAGEISARTQASLEIVRLKETRKVEQEHEAAEKQALKDEILQLRQELEKERKKSVLARQESGSWRESFEEVVRIEEARLPPSSARITKIRNLRPKSTSFDR